MGERERENEKHSTRNKRATKKQSKNRATAGVTALYLYLLLQDLFPPAPMLCVLSTPIPLPQPLLNPAPRPRAICQSEGYNAVQRFFCRALCRVSLVLDVVKL